MQTVRVSDNSTSSINRAIDALRLAIEALKTGSTSVTNTAITNVIAALTLTGDVTGATSISTIATTLARIPNAVNALGSILFKTIAAPAAPADTAHAHVYVDSSSINLCVKPNAGLGPVRHCVATVTAPAHQFLTNINDDGSVGTAQPDYTDVSGLATIAHSGSATDLTTGSLPAARIPNALITGPMLNNSGTTAGRIGAEILIDKQVLSAATSYTSPAITNFKSVRWVFKRTGGSATSALFTLTGLITTCTTRGRLYDSHAGTYTDFSTPAAVFDFDASDCVNVGEVFIDATGPKLAVFDYSSDYIADGHFRIYWPDTGNTATAMVIAWSGGNVTGTIELWGIRA